MRLANADVDATEGGRLTRRRFIGGCALTGAGLLVAACSSSTATGPGSATSSPSLPAPLAASSAPASASSSSPSPSLAPSIVAAQPSPSLVVPPLSSPVAGQSVPQVTVAYSSTSIDQLPLWMAEEAGLFTSNGLTVNTSLLTGGQSLEALLAGETQLADVGGGEVISAVATGADIVVVATPAPTVPFLFGVGPDITTFDDLKGKKIATTTIGSSSYVAVRLILQKEGLHPDTDVVFVPGLDAGATLAALSSGAVQGGVIDRSLLPTLQPSQVHILFDPAAPGNGIPIASTTLAVTRSWRQANRPVVQSYVNALVEAIAREKADQPFTMQVLEKYYNTTDDTTLTPLYQFASQTQPTLPYPQADQFTSVSSQMAQLNPKITSVDVTSFLDPSFVQNAANNHLGGS